MWHLPSKWLYVLRGQSASCDSLSQVSYTELMINKYLLCDSSSFLGTSSKISSRRSKNSSFLLRNGNSLLQVSTGDEWFLVRPLILDTMRSSCFDKTLELYCHSCQLLSLQDLTVVPVGGWGWACDSNASASLFSWATGKACSHYDKEDSSAKKEIPPGSQATNNGVCVCVCVRAHTRICAYIQEMGEKSLHPLQQTSGISVFRSISEWVSRWESHQLYHGKDHEILYILYHFKTWGSIGYLGYVDTFLVLEG